MNISELQQKLNESHAQFISTIRNVSDADFTKSVNQKWTAGQQLEHIIKSVAPVNQAFGLPGFALKMLFGKANRASLLTVLLLRPSPLNNARIGSKNLKNLQLP